MEDFYKTIVDAYENGELLESILLNKVLPCLQENFNHLAWSSLNIDYHPPKVERLWCQLGPMRLMIHRIHSCDESVDALFHPHPWPSAVYILKGSYEMGIGYGETKDPPPVAATATLAAKSSYAMDARNGWHYVSPKSKTSLSVMLVGSPWKEPHPFYTENARVRLNPLTEKVRKSLVRDLLAWLDENPLTGI